MKNNKLVKGKKIKLYRYHRAGAKGERRYSSYSRLASVIDGGKWSASRPGRATPRYPLDRRQGGPHSWSGHRN
jgi:hypothetical protein